MDYIDCTESDDQKKDMIELKRELHKEQMKNQKILEEETKKGIHKIAEQTQKLTEYEDLIARKSNENYKISKIIDLYKNMTQ